MAVVHQLGSRIKHFWRIIRVNVVIALLMYVVRWLITLELNLTGPHKFDYLRLRRLFATTISCILKVYNANITKNWMVSNLCNQDFCANCKWNWHINKIIVQLYSKRIKTCFVLKEWNGCLDLSPKVWCSDISIHWLVHFLENRIGRVDMIKGVFGRAFMKWLLWYEVLES